MQIVFTDPQAAAARLHNVALFASNDRSRPILTAVEFVTTDIGVRVAATDSYALGTDVLMCEAPSGSDTDETNGGAVLVCAAALAKFAKTVKAVESITTSKDGEEVVIAGGGQTVTVDRIQGDYPTWQKLVPAPTDSPVGSTTLNVGIIVSRFVKVLADNHYTATASKRDTVIVKLDLADKPLRPLRFSFVGASLTGIYMPVNVDR